MSILIPKRIFIVPYRNRLEHKFFYSNQMSFILENDTDYEIYFSHQCDNRQFNRGAAKNIGFLAMKKKYPEHYKQITFIFNDVDTLPFHKIFDYETIPGKIKHYYGFEYALGGIVVIKGVDFEKVNGYPNFWGWGNEDTVFQNRCNYYNILIDRSQFYKIGSPEILQLFDGVTRLITPTEHHQSKNDDGIDGIESINRLTFSIDVESLNPKDNKYTVQNNKIFVINILSFLTHHSFSNNQYYDYDLREKTNKIINPDINKLQHKRVVDTNDWKDIPNINLNDANIQYQNQTKELNKNKMVYPVKKQQPPQKQQQTQKQDYEQQQQRQKQQRYNYEMINNYIKQQYNLIKK